MSNYQDVLKNLDKEFCDWFKYDKYKIPKMTKDLYPFKNIFSPIKVNRLTIKNRIVMAPMGNVSMCDETGKPNSQMISYFEERAKGGVGLITTGLVPISYGIDNSLIEKDKLVYFPRIDRSRTVFAGWRDLTAKCHAHGSLIFVQISAGLGRVGNPQCLTTQFKFPVSASWNPNFYIPQIPCKRLSDRECTKIIKKIGQAGADSKASNFDGIYLHGHEGYLLEQMTNTAYNRRSTGKYADWQRFGIDTIKEIRKRCGNNYAIMYRIDLSLMLNETYKDKMDSVKALKKFKDERTVEQTLDYMTNLVKAGVDMFDVDLGSYDNWWLPHPPASMPPACFLEISDLVKNYFKEKNIVANTGLPVVIVGVGKLGYPDVAEKALNENRCDMVMLGRPLLADADWCNKAYAGNVLDIRPCIGCQEACINEFVEAGHPQCAVNPRTAFEFELSENIPLAEKSKKVAVIGAGPAGIVASEVLLKRGHSVDLFEKKDKVGGSIYEGSVPKIKYEMASYLEYLNHLTEKMKQNKKFQLFLSTKADATTLKDKYDVVLFASGARQCKPPVEGINNANVKFGVDVLANPDLVKNAKDIVVIGGGIVGCEVAYMLRYELNKNVKVIEMMPYIMNHSCTANRGHLIHYFEEGNVELLNCTKLNKIKEGSIEVTRNTDKNVPNPYVTWNPILPENVPNPLAKKIGEKLETQEIKCDMVLLTAGVASENSLYFDCVANNVAKEIYNIGDSLKPARVFEAVRAAYRKARAI